MNNETQSPCEQSTHVGARRRSEGRGRGWGGVGLRAGEIMWDQGHFGCTAAMETRSVLEQTEPKLNIMPDPDEQWPHRLCAQVRTYAQQEQARAVASGQQHIWMAGRATTS